MSDLWERFKHWGFGCREYNRQFPHWEDRGGEFPVCSICGNQASYMYGYKKWPPDYVAQSLIPPDREKTNQTKTSIYWARYDGWLQ